MGGKLVLGTWQGIYLWEHRQQRYNRELVVHVSGDREIRNILSLSSTLPSPKPQAFKSLVKRVVDRSNAIDLRVPLIMGHAAQIRQY